MNAARSVHQKQRHSHEGGILELSVEFGLFDLIGSLSAVHADATDGRTEFIVALIKKADGFTPASPVRRPSQD